MSNPMDVRNNFVLGAVMSKRLFLAVGAALALLAAMVGPTRAADHDIVDPQGDSGSDLVVARYGGNPGVDIVSSDVQMATDASAVSFSLELAGPYRGVGVRWIFEVDGTGIWVELHNGAPIQFSSSFSKKPGSSVTCVGCVVTFVGNNVIVNVPTSELASYTSDNVARLFALEPGMNLGRVQLAVSHNALVAVTTGADSAVGYDVHI